MKTPGNQLQHMALLFTISAQVKILPCGGMRLLLNALNGETADLRSLLLGFFPRVSFHCVYGHGGSRPTAACPLRSFGRAVSLFGKSSSMAISSLLLSWMGIRQVGCLALVQGDPLGHNALLLHGNNLPLLSSTRAVLFEHTDTISRLFQTAQFPEACFPHRFVCAVHFSEGGHEVSLTTSDLANIPHAKFVQAYMRTLEEDISDDEQSECSTR